MEKTFLIFLLSTTHHLLCRPTELIFATPFTITGHANSTTFFLHDAAGNQFVLKYHPRGPKRAIHETLGAYIGKSIGLNINEVEVFSPHDPFTQPSQFGVVTLHSRVPGVQVKDIKDMNHEIWIKKGLCDRTHLDSLIEYPELCCIVAFDIFIDNTDRHNRNLFFDKKTRQFYAIDMDHGFKSANTLVDTPHDYDFDTLAVRAYKFVKTLTKKRLSSQEIKALKCIQQTLQQLADRHTPQTLFEEWMAIGKKAGVMYNPREQGKIKKYLEYNADQVSLLLMQLDKLLAVH
jgi:hypothetical protein